MAETKLHRDNRHGIERDLIERRSSLGSFNGGHGANDKWSVDIAAQKRDEYSNVSRLVTTTWRFFVFPILQKVSITSIAIARSEISLAQFTPVGLVRQYLWFWDW